MGTLFSVQTQKEPSKNIWPSRYFRNIPPGEDLENSRFGYWAPSKYREQFQYPNKEPAKDF